MQILTLLPVFLAAGAYAGCYSGGESWGDRQVALNSAQAACDAGLSGDFDGNTNKATCMDGNGIRFNFSVHRLQSSRGSLSAAECFDGLQREINGCANGGDTSYGTWRFV
jgi:hypothetical protein